ncbi:PAS domain S-box protein [Halobaculum sp. WSA2]|uniref:histidine kinase n=1 Tax=Halobaculum saliterrae TaxID=2073113 RepID=A0A6B0SY95_9EURY|nr:PAS domain S-box protein [Halobaculum saliterrae]MXR42496.1 PAS domain S-box protein [Halobaculum saliterrae]
MAPPPGSPALHERLDTLTRRRPATVLHVDDDREFADLVSIYLEREADTLEVITETSPRSALDRLQTEAVDCIVSDYDMPQTDGLEFLEAVREEFPDLPFLLFTGKGSEEIASEAISAGVTDYLQKEGGTDQYTLLANRVENAVQQSRANREIHRGFSAIETAREGIAFLDEEGTIRYVNSAYTDVYGYTREEMIGKHWEMLYPDEDVEQVYEEILPAVPETGTWDGENVHVRRDGSRIVVSHALTYADDGTLLCLIRDITEERATERSLEQERQRFEEFVDAVEDYAVFSLDPDGFVTSWNRGAEQLTGYSNGEILGEHFSEFYPAERVDAGDPAELLETALAEGSVEDTGWRVRRDGTTFRATAVITAVFDDDGHHRGFTNVTRDTSRPWGEERTTDAREGFLERALDVLEDVFYVLDSEGAFVRVTDRATAVTGYSREELLAMSPTDLFTPADRPRIRKDLEEALETGSTVIEADLRTKGGRTVPFEFRKRRLVDEAGDVYLVGIGRDISERKRRERQLERQLDQFEHFGSVLAHDVRTPLDTARGRLELARETDDDVHLEKAEIALDRLDELVDDLANVMREGELVREPTEVDMSDSLRSVWDSLETGDATLTVETDGRIRADGDAFGRLLENLLKNAVEHGGDEVAVTVGSLPDGFYVEDDGPGIPEGERDRVFEAGYSTKGTDAGFGMASVRQLVIAHGWEITATEGRDGGARFEITDVDVVGRDA